MPLIDENMSSQLTFCVNVWKEWILRKNIEIENFQASIRPLKTDILDMAPEELNSSLCLFVKEVRNPNGTEYTPDLIFFLVLGVQDFLNENDRFDNIFADAEYEHFIECFDEVAKKFTLLKSSTPALTRVEEEHLWEAKQLGAHSPHVLLSTLIYFNMKYFKLRNFDEHLHLKFSQITKHLKRSPKKAILRFHPHQVNLEANSETTNYEQNENTDDPLRCPVRLYEFYLSKCSERIKMGSSVFYLQPDYSCAPVSSVWYLTEPIKEDTLRKIIHRFEMVKELN